MIYEVDEKLLIEFKIALDCYGYHHRKCSYHQVEFCDCGYTDTIKKLKKLSEELVKKHEPS
jgi:hypothetical protein